MTAAGPAGQDTARSAAGGQRREREIEVEEILPDHTATTATARAGHSTGGPSPGPERAAGTARASRRRPSSGILAGRSATFWGLLPPSRTGDQGRGLASRDGTGSGAGAGD